MSETWADCTRAAVMKAIEAVEALPPEARREMLLSPLRASADRLMRGADAPTVAELLRSAMAPVVVAATDGLCSADVAFAVGAAYCAALMGKAVPLDVPADAHPQPPTEIPRLMRTRDIPEMRTVARAQFKVYPKLDEKTLEVPEEAPVEAPASRESDDEETDLAALLGEEAHNDWRTTEGVRDAKPPVRVAETPPPMTAAVFRAAIVEEALDRIAIQGWSRAEHPLAGRKEAEAQIGALLDACFATGGDCVTVVLAWWSRSLALSNPWVSWAASLVLFAIAGEDALAALRVGIEALSPGATDHAELVSEALSVVARPDHQAFGARLRAAPHPVARAVGVDLLARKRQLSADELRHHALDANVAVMAAAVRGVGLLPQDEAAPLLTLLDRLSRFPNVSVAWPAVRTLLRFGELAPYQDVRNGGRLASILGKHALEVFVLAGGPHDRPAIERLAGKGVPTPLSLDAIARFGDPGVFTYLAYQLENEDLADDAARALTTLFGERVPDRDRKSIAAWRHEVAALRLDRAIRYRRGEPWKPSVVAAECSTGELPRRSVEQRLDELAIRASIAAVVDFSRWSSESDPALVSVCGAARSADARWLNASWG